MFSACLIVTSCTPLPNSKRLRRMMAASANYADDNRIAQEFGGSERRLSSVRGMSVMAVRLEEQSFLVTMTKL